MVRLAALLSLAALLVAPAAGQAKPHKPNPNVPQHHGKRPSYVRDLPPLSDAQKAKLAPSGKQHEQAATHLNRRRRRN